MKVELQLIINISTYTYNEIVTKFWDVDQYIIFLVMHHKSRDSSFLPIGIITFLSEAEKKEKKTANEDMRTKVKWKYS